MYIRSTRSNYVSREKELRKLVAEGLRKNNRVKLGDGYLVRIPEIKGRINRIKRDKSVYVEYVYERKYDPETKQTRNKKAIIGVIVEGYPGAMLPNDNYGKYFDAVTGALKQPENDGEKTEAEGTDLTTETGTEGSGTAAETVSGSEKGKTNKKTGKDSKSAKALEGAANNRVMHPWRPEDKTEEEKRRDWEMGHNAMKEMLDSAIRRRMKEQKEDEKKEREQYNLELYGEENPETEGRSLEDLIRERKRLDEETYENYKEPSEEEIDRVLRNLIGDTAEAGNEDNMENGDYAYSEEALQESYRDFNALRERIAILSDILTKIHKSIKTQAKRRPDDIISEFKAKKINSILAEIKEKYAGTGYDDLLELIEVPREIRKDEEIYVIGPSYSDVEVILDHYASILHFIKVKKK